MDKQLFVTNKLYILGFCLFVYKSECLGFRENVDFLFYEKFQTLVSVV